MVIFPPKMMPQLMSLAMWLFLALQPHITASITLGRDGGYKNIVIKIDNSVPEDYCHIYIQNLKEMLSDASSVLKSGLGGRVYLSQVTLVIPSHWRNPRCHYSVDFPKRDIVYQDADVMVMSDSPIYGSSPHTQQSRGCGQPGDKIIIPQSFLKEWNATKQVWPRPGKLFAKEWAKLRYGVFDELGYPGDPLYQNFFKVQDKVLHSGTSDTPVEGEWKYPNGTLGCDPKTGSCMFHPSTTEGANDKVTCSLGYMPQLPNVNRWCDMAGPLSPTKHNILCSAKSALQVINSHRDFQNLQQSSTVERTTVPRFDIVRQPLPKYVLLIETSSSLSPVWKWIRKAVQNLIRYVVPNNINVAVVTFNTKANVEHSMVELTNDESTRSRMADSIPDSPNKLEHNSQEGCVQCGFQKTMDEVLKDKEAGGHVIIIAKEDISEESLNQKDEILSMAQRYGVRISSVIVTSSNNGLQQPYSVNSRRSGAFFFETLAKRTGGVSMGVSKDSYTMQMYSNVIQALNDIVAIDTEDPLNHAVTLHNQFYRRTDAAPTDGAFMIDSTLGRNTEFGIYVADNEDHQIKSVLFTDNESVEYGPFTKMSSSYDVVNFKTINYNIGEEPPFDLKRGTTWKYRIEWYGGASTRQNVVIVRSSPSALKTNDLIKIKAWTNLADGEDVDPDNLLAIFVQVEKGQRPVFNARVRVLLSVEDENGGVATKDSHEIQLLDNGYGEPDLTRGDGIYSRYVTKYPSAGKYSYKVIVDDNNGAASTVSPGQVVTARGQPCCGSFVPVPANRTESIGVFDRTITGQSVHINNIRLGGGDKIRPGKIGDLKMEVMPEQQQLLATWTAPGGDFNDGKVITYRFVFSQRMEELLTPSTVAPALEGLRETFSPGTLVKKAINFKYYNAYYYIGLYASDEAGNRGRMSNIVLVRVPAPPTTTDVTSTEPIVLEPRSDWTLVGAIIGGIVVILLAILVGLYCRFFRRSQGRFSKIRFANHLKSNGVRIPGTAELDRKDSSNGGSSVNSGVGGNGGGAGQVYEEKGNNMVNNIPHPKVSNTSFANNLTPTYWSASQLLAEHEIRKQQEHMQQLQAQQPSSLRSNPMNGGSDLSRTNEGLWVEPEDYMNTRIPGGYSEYSTNPAGTRDEFDYPDVVNYNPGSNYSVDHLGDSRPQYTSNGGINPPGFSYRPEYAVHHTSANDYSDYGGMHSDYGGVGGMMAGVNGDYGLTGDVGELPPGVVGEMAGVGGGGGMRDYDSVLNKSSQRLMNSDVSSSTLGITNPSLLGSQLSIYSGLPGASRNSGPSKNRNITQV